MSMVCVLRGLDEARLAEVLSEPERAFDLLAGPDAVDLDKAWHGIHFLLTRSAWDGDEPWCFLCKGGQPVGDEEGVGYGPARLLQPAQVAAWAQALAGISADELRRRFDPAAMRAAEIYPAIWDRDPKVDAALGYLIEHYAVLTAFVKQASDRRLSVLLCLM